MNKLNDLAKYKISQIEGIIKQHKMVRGRYWILVIIFSTLMSVFGALSIIALSFYISHYIDNYPMFYLAITSSVLFGACLTVFFVFIGLNHAETVTIKRLEAYLKNNKKK